MSHLSKKQLGAYAIGDTGANLLWGVTMIFLPFFYTDVALLTPAAVGTLLLVARVFDAVNDPVIGALADRSESRFGRYRQWVGVGAFFASTLFIACFVLVDGPGDLWIAYLTYILFGLAYTAMNIPYGTLGTAMTRDPNHRRRLSSARSFGALVGMLLVSIATPALLELWGGKKNAASYLPLAFLYGAVALAFSLTTALVTREKIAVSSGSRASVFAPLIEAMKEANMRWLFVTVTMMLLAFSASGGMAVYLFERVLSDPEGLGPYMMVGAAAMVVGIAVVGPMVMKRFGEIHCALFGLVLSALAMLIVYFVYDDQNLLLAANALTGVGDGMFLSSIWAIVGNVVDQPSKNEDEPAEFLGSRYAAVSFFMKIGTALGAAIPSYWLGMRGYSGEDSQTSPAVAEAIVQMMTLLPVLTYVLGAGALWMARQKRIDVVR